MELKIGHWLFAVKRVEKAGLKDISDRQWLQILKAEKLNLITTTISCPFEAILGKLKPKFLQLTLDKLDETTFKVAMQWNTYRLEILKLFLRRIVEET